MKHPKFLTDFILTPATAMGLLVRPPLSAPFALIILFCLLLMPPDVAVAGAFMTTTWTSGVAPSTASDQCLVGDFNGDGRSDIACYTGSGGYWAIALANTAGMGFNSPPAWASGVSPGLPISDQCFAGDFNGDGLTDIACYTGSGGNWAVALSTGTGFSSFVWSGVVPSNPVSDQCMTGDFNADGKTDIICQISGGSTWSVALSTGTGFTAVTWTGGASPGTPITRQCFTGDFNGDGLTDIACWTGTGAVWTITLSTGAGFAPQQNWTAGFTPTSYPVTNQCTPGDFNGDGLTDIGCYTGSSIWSIAFSTGTAFNSSSWGGRGFSTGADYRPLFCRRRCRQRPHRYRLLYGLRHRMGSVTVNRNRLPATSLDKRP